MNRDIYLSNSLGGKKEKFTPINPKKVRMYVCGPTGYDDPHIGNARPLVVSIFFLRVLNVNMETLQFYTQEILLTLMIKL